MDANLYSVLLENLASANRGHPLGHLAEALLANRDAPDPELRARLLKEYLLNRPTEDGSSVAPSLPRPSARTPRADTVQRVREKVQELQCELAELRRRNDELAGALGACPSCWGEDPICYKCGGQGHPGEGIQDQALFERWVAPGLKTHTQYETDSGPVRGNSQRVPGTEISEGEK